MLRRLLRDLPATFGLMVVLAVVVLAIGGASLAPYPAEGGRTPPPPTCCCG